MRVKVVAVYRKRVRMVRGFARVHESLRHWLVLSLGGELAAIGISAKSFRELRRSGVSLSKVAVHAIRKGSS